MLKSITILYVILLNLLYADTLLLESGVKRNTLIELYTSEGCSSCPPAEEFLNNLTKNNELWKTWVPIAFHVNYWDYIGWKDEYAHKTFGQRQSRYANLKHVSTVYTPAFMVNGNSWRPGFFSKILPKDKTSVGNLVVSANHDSVTATFKSQIKLNMPLKLNVAILGMGLTSHIERGENEGRTAKHEFVVVGFNSTVSNNSQWNMKLPALHNTQANNYALAVWVSKIDDPSPIQAVGGLFPNYKK